jgi:hypothetical protein
LGFGDFRIEGFVRAMFRHSAEVCAADIGPHQIRQSTNHAIAKSTNPEILNS